MIRMIGRDHFFGTEARKQLSAPRFQLVTAVERLADNRVSMQQWRRAARRFSAIFLPVMSIIAMIQLLRRRNRTFHRATEPANIAAATT
jgi:hypothetical protein